MSVMALSDEAGEQQLANFGASALPGTSADFRKFVAAEVHTWARVIRFAHVRAD
jgi:hypothetical protein